MPTRIATAPVSWGILEFEGWEWPQTYDEVLDEMVQAGYSGTELGPYGFFPKDPAELRRVLKKREMSLLGAFVPLPLSDPTLHSQAVDAALEVGRLLSDAGAPFLVLADRMDEKRMQIAGSAREKDGLSDEQWKQAAELVTQVAEAAKPLGLRCAFHHHCGTFVETPRETDRLLELTDPELVGVCFDTGHFSYGGGDPVEWARSNGDRIWHIHLKDVRSEVLDETRRDKIHYMDAVRKGLFCPLGDGGVDLVGVLQELDRQGFDGWAVFEQDIDPSVKNAKAVDSAIRSREYLRRAAGL